MVDFYSLHLTPSLLARDGPKLLDRVMRKRWPATFDTPKPLKIGIAHDLASEGVPCPDVRLFLTWYTATPEYLRAQAEPDAVRYDLRGLPVEPVSPENRSYAAQKLSVEPKE